MRVYTSGRTDAPAILLLPGTCCDWEANFGKVIPLLSREFHVLTVSYDGFDAGEQTEFPTMLEETEKIEAWIQQNLGAGFEEYTAALWAAPLWDCWRHGGTFTWTMVFWAVPIWTSPLPLRQSL